ncbi:SMI1/KNR4 family protein [Thiofilum flexile]|uniref:SMI1/KNR4 family protein n=1 Tax=Thiofilum flexile TaxID=125627 RepID=UPI00037690CF|nr:SMI1/KNR4 family protein [Thiofilum flexile]
MHNIIKAIEEKFKLYKTKGASDELIAEAERQLNLRFADDYKKYLSQFGAISFGSTELTGLNIDSYANVVSVTLKEIQRNASFPKNSIVLENTGVEGLLILQKEDGEIYEWVDGEKRVIFPSLKEYLKSKISS